MLPFRLLKHGSIARKIRAVRWQSSSVLDQYKAFQPGKKLQNYTVEQVTHVPELALVSVVLKHDKTGAQHLHVARDDSNNVFAVAFQTTPLEDTGVPHILEHTVLCGSKTFPVRDPFFKMLDRSLSTFMNAFTSADWTMYPFSTQNPKDFKNLLSVYLDAAFFPLLQESDFRQEGWRLEHENPDDRTSPLVIKGVVFNEMKGVFSDSQNIFSQKLVSATLPSHTYGHNYGGDPLQIPTLSWDGLRHFHASHYHPSNARFFTYGNFPLEQHLELISNQALDKFEPTAPQPPVPLEERWSQPKMVRTTCPPDPMAPDPNKQTTVAVSYLLKEVTDFEESFTLFILSELLVGGENSPFYQSLIESKLGSDFSPELGYDNHTKEARFSVGLQGLKEDDVDRVCQIIQDTFDKAIKEGFSKKQIEAVLHRIELSLRHQTEKFGLGLGMNVVSHWLHGGDPGEGMQIEDKIINFRKKLQANSRFLQDKVQEYFKTNKHYVTLVMSPDTEFEQKRQQAEAELLQNKVTSLSQEEKDVIFSQGKELANLQSGTQDLSCLPSLQLSDIDRNVQTLHFEQNITDGVPIQYCPQPTNGVTYFRALSSLAELPQELLPYVPLFCNVVTKMAAGLMDYKDLAEMIDLKTGGLSVVPIVHLHPSDAEQLERGVLFTSYCLDKNIDSMFQLWSDIFSRVDLNDADRLHTLIAMEAASLASNLIGGGHRYAMMHAGSSLSPAGWLEDMFGGMGFVGCMKTLAEQQDLRHIVEHLQDIARNILNKKNLRCSVNCTQDTMETTGNRLDNLIHSLYHPEANKSEKIGKTHFYDKADDFHRAEINTQFELPFQVNFASRAVRTAPFNDPDFARLRLLGRLMTTKFLHREIREKGGAYGGGAHGNQPGLFSFYSYRDPNSDKTFESFDKAVEWALSGQFSDQDLKEAKLGVFQQVDMPVPPGNKGQREFLLNITDEMRKEHRLNLLDCTHQQLIQAAEKYLHSDNRFSSMSLLGPENKIFTEASDWKIKHV